MQYVTLGRTGVKISRLGLGCGSFGGLGSDPRFFGKGQSETEAFALMDRAYEMGINFFDTADTYGGGRSESIIGSWLKTKSSDVRQQILVSSKVFNPVGDGPNDGGLSRRHILRQVDSSLKRLGVERLDMYLAHEVDPETPLEETLTAFDDVIRQGKVHYIGASNWEAWRLTRALWVSDRLGLASFAWMQNSYSLLEQDPESEMLPLCQEQGLGFTPYSSLAGGWLTGKYRAGKDYPARVTNDDASRTVPTLDAGEDLSKCRRLSRGGKVSRHRDGHSGLRMGVLSPANDRRHRRSPEAGAF